MVLQGGGLVRKMRKHVFVGLVYTLGPTDSQQPWALASPNNLKTDAPTHCNPVELNATQSAGAATRTQELAGLIGQPPAGAAAKKRHSFGAGGAHWHSAKKRCRQRLRRLSDRWCV